MRKFNLITCILLSLSFILVGCVDQDYDLQKKDINTDISIGSGLTLPLGSIAKKSLGDLLNADELKELKENEDGSYKLSVKDSIKQGFALGSIDDITIPSPTLTAIVPDFGTTGKFPDFVLRRDELTIDGGAVTFPSVASLNIPKIDVKTGIVLPPELVRIPNGFPLGEWPAGLNIFYPVNQANPAQPPVDYQSVPFIMDYALPENLIQIKKLVLNNTKVAITVDLNDVRALLGTSNGQYFKMEMVFPSQFKLSVAPGMGVAIDQNNKVTMEWNIKATDSPKKTFQFSLDEIVPRPVVGADLSNSDYKLVNGVKHLALNSTIGYKLAYNIVGNKNGSTTPPDNPKIAVDFNITPQLSHALVDISQIAIPNITQNITLDTKISGIPAEIKAVNKITFAANPVKPALNIKITPGQAMPFDFAQESKVNVIFPSSFSFVAGQQDKGLKFVEGAGWMLEIPAAKLFDTHSLLLDAIDLTGYNIVGGVIDFAQADKPMVIRVATIEQLKFASQTDYDTRRLPETLSTAMKLSGINMNLAIESAEVKAVMSTKFSESSKTSQAIAKPKELIALSAINLVKDATHGNKIDFGMKITGIPDGIKTIDFSNVVISMPKFVKLKDSAVEGIVVDNSDPDSTLVKINKQFPVSKSEVVMDVNMVVDKLFFAKSPIVNDKIQIDFNVGFTGSINIPESKISTDQLNGITVTPTINIDNLAISSVVGKFDVDFPVDPMDIQLGDMSFDKAEINFALFDAIFKIDIFNPTSLPIDLQLSLLPKGSDNKVIDAQKIEIDPITIVPNGLTKLEISKDAKDKTTTDGDVKGIKKNMAQLFYPIMPSSVEIHVVPGIDKSVEHTVVLQKEDYELKVKYDIDIPLKFDKAFNVRYKDAVRDIKADLGDVIDVLSSLQVDLDIENAIPLELLVNITPIDKDSVSLADKIDIGLYRRSASSDDCTIAAGDSDAASITDLKLLFKEKEKGALKNLDGLSFEIVARPNQNATNGAALNKKQYIHIKNIKARVIEDINISLDKKTKE